MWWTYAETKFSLCCSFLQHWQLLLDVKWEILLASCWLSYYVDTLHSVWTNKSDFITCKMSVWTVSLKNGIWKLNRIYAQYKIFFLFFSVPLSCSEGFTELGYYNGTVSQTDSGSPCLKWTEFPDYVQQYPGRGLGEHNFCRNPDRESNPWCFFRQSSGAIGWAYCDCHQGKYYSVSLKVILFCRRE